MSVICSRYEVRRERRVPGRLHLFEESQGSVHLARLRAHVYAGVVVDEVRRQPVATSSFQLCLQGHRQRHRPSFFGAFWEVGSGWRSDAKICEDRFQPGSRKKGCYLLRWGVAKSSR